MIYPDEISDPKVRSWYLSHKKPQDRKWLIPIYAGNSGDSKYLQWIKREIIKDEEAVVLATSEKSKEIANQIFTNSHIELYLDAAINENLLNILKKHEINAFFSHATFHRPIYLLRKLFLQEPWFSSILAIWHEGGFLRKSASKNKCFQLDWMGWNAISSLAVVDWNKVPDLTPIEIDFTNNFMKQFQYEKQKEAKLEIITSKKNLQDICTTTKPIVFIPLQVYSDSVIQNFVPQTMRDLTRLFQFAESRDDCFFVFKEHPKQLSEAPHLQLNKTGKNYIYMDSNCYETLSIATNADIVLALNSTVGFESLFWTPVVTIGRSGYSTPFVSYMFKDFSPSLPMKPKENILKFLHYAITKFHYSTGVNANTHQEWFNFLSIYRLSQKHLIQRQNRLLEFFPTHLRH